MSFFIHFFPLNHEEKVSSLDNLMLTAFHNALGHVCILTTVSLVNNSNDGSFLLPSKDVLEGVTCDFIEQHDVGYTCPQQTAEQSS